MRTPALLLALLLAASPAGASAPLVDEFARTVNTGPLQVSFDFENPDRLARVVLPAWDPVENLAGSDLGGAYEFFGQSLRGVLSSGYTTAYDLVQADWSVVSRNDSTVVVRAETQTAGEPPVRTDWTFRGGSAEVRVERTLRFADTPDSAAFQPFVARMAFVASYRAARWRGADGRVTTGLYCWDGCPETSWNGRWLEYYTRKGSRFQSVAIAPASTNPPYAGFVRSVGLESYTAALSPLRAAGLHDRDETHRFLLRFSTTAGDTAVLDAMQARLDAALGPLDAPAPAPAPLALTASPNPARGATRLAWTLPRAGHATLDVLDVTGRRVMRLWAGESAAGAHEARWNGAWADGTPAAPGVYLAVLRTADGAAVRRIVRAR